MPLSEGKRKPPFWRALIGCSKTLRTDEASAESWQQQLSGEFPFRQQFHASQRQTAWLYWLNLFGCTSDLLEQRSLASRARPLRPCSPAASQPRSLAAPKCQSPIPAARLLPLARTGTGTGTGTGTAHEPTATDPPLAPSPHSNGSQCQSPPPHFQPPSLPPTPSLQARAPPT